MGSGGAQVADKVSRRAVPAAMRHTQLSNALQQCRRLPPWRACSQAQRLGASPHLKAGQEMLVCGHQAVCAAGSRAARCGATPVHACSAPG